MLTTQERDSNRCLIDSQMDWTPRLYSGNLEPRSFPDQNKSSRCDTEHACQSYWLWVCARLLNIYKHILCSCLNETLCRYLQYKSAECVGVVSAQNTPNHIILKKACFEWKQKGAVFMHVSLNANELLPPPFSRTELGAAKHICFGSNHCVYCTEIMRFKSY